MSGRGGGEGLGTSAELSCGLALTVHIAEFNRFIGFVDIGKKKTYW